MTEEAPLKKAVRILAVLIFAVSLSAQLRTGNVHGKISDKEGKPLAGVRVTLSRPQAADQKTVTGVSGIYRFPSAFPGTDYTVKAELADFKTVSRANVVVMIGGSSAVDLVLEAGKPEEQVNVTAAAPAIDRRKMTAGAHFGWTELQTLPTARDPWVIVQLVPSVMLDRENVGGNESSQQSAFVAKGDNANGAANVWTVDGVDVTDPLALGTSAINFDFDAIDAIAVTTGGASDVALQTGGIALNLVTRRGGNKISAAARFYLTDGAFQSDNLTSALRSEGIANTNRIQQIRDFGANAGGPIIKDRIWWWGAYGVQDSFTYTIYDFQDRTLFSNYSFKLNARPINGNRFEALFITSSRERFGANASTAKLEGDHQTGRYRLGSPIFKLQDEQTVGNDFFMSVKFSYNNTGASTRPMIDEDLSDPVTYDVGNGIYVPFSYAYGRSWDSRIETRTKKDFQLTATLYRDSLFGMAHEIKGGFELSDRTAASEWGFSQNFEVFRNFVDPMIDLGEGLVVPPPDWQYIQFGRENRELALAKRASGYLQDTIAKGRLTLTLGLRYDYQVPSTGAYTLATVMPSNAAWSAVFETGSLNALGTSLPPIAVKAVKPKYQWSTWSPRIGLSWDISGDGRTVAKLALSQYGDVMSAGANTPRPLGLGGGLGFWWNDTDADNRVALDEIFWQYSSVHPDSPYELYGLFDAAGQPSEAAEAALEGGFESDAYLAGNYWDYDWSDRRAVNYDNLTTFYRSDIDPEAKNVKTSPRTREIMLGLERELRPDLIASVTATFRRYDNFDWAKLYYPADIYPGTPDLVIDNTRQWYTVAGTIPGAVTIDEESFDMGDAAGKPWYLPIAEFPGETPYRMVDKSTSFRTYFGLDLAVTKRLAKRWFLNASVTLQDQRAHWGDSYIDPTNKWAFDGKPFGNWGGGAGGKISVQMYARWMAKVTALYQLPLGINVSATFLAREGWKIPTYVTLAYAGDDPWPGLVKSNTVFVQATTKDSLPVFHNLTFRIEKKITIGSGKMVVMADVFNALNSAIVNRAYDAYYGTYYINTGESSANPFNRLYNEILNPRVWRFGLRFEF
ncbi:MAG: hypothetical protein A2028_04040 [Candidatus Aminicenantes bacterium RBG_19FT_COMBO_59_29]|nr:MAG: hypothetical protein A2028_04040 [Candidatus Aminicenantes bacterium RBG_19FT_COMBO_59_29]